MPARRECLPSEERDAFVASRIKSGINKIAVRVTERYIDEFLRFCEEEHGFSTPKKITAEIIGEYAALQLKKPILKDTKRLKVREVLNWIDWLAKEGVINKNPAEALDATELVP